MSIQVTKTFQLHDIDIEVTKKRIKNIHLRVRHSDGKVHISAPLRMSFKFIYDFAFSKLEWIQKNRQNVNANLLDLKFIEGERHYFCGKSYGLRIENYYDSSRVKLEDNAIVLHIHPDFCSKKRQMLLEYWYKTELKNILAILIAKWEPVMQVKVSQFSIRKMKTRWGSCSYRTGKIRFNLELAKRSVACIEYIVIHEMVHLLEASHNYRFKAFMDKFMPDWRVYQKELRCLKF